MAQTVRLTITPDLENALQILHKSTMGTLNTTELIKLAVGELAKQKEKQITRTTQDYQDLSPQEQNRLSARLYYEWAKEDGTLEVDNIAHPEKLKPFVPTPNVRTR